MFGLLRILFLLILIGYAYCWWRSKRDPAPGWLSWRRGFARAGVVLLLLVLLPLIFRRLAL